MTPPPSRKRALHSHLDTPTRARFFEAIDRRGERTKLSIFREFNIPETTGYRILRERDTYGELADRRTKLRQHKKLETGIGSGRPLKISDEALQKMIDAPLKIRSRKLEHQMAYAGVSDVSRETVRRSLRTRMDAAMYRASTQSDMLPDQAHQRFVYTPSFCFEPTIGFWDGVLFTEEAHMSLTELPDPWILRLRGERHKQKNIVPLPKQRATSVYFAAWVNFYEKADHLTFFNHEYDDVEPKKPRAKPRQGKRELNEQFAERLRLWDAEKSKDIEMYRTSNSMRAIYYTKKILPIYHEAYHSLVERSNTIRAYLHPDRRYNWYIIEDNDPSHSTRNPNSLPATYRASYGIKTLSYLVNSADLNPIEGIWSVIKERVRRYIDQL